MVCLGHRNTLLIHLDVVIVRRRSSWHLQIRLSSPLGLMHRLFGIGHGNLLLYLKLLLFCLLGFELLLLFLHLHALDVFVDLHSKDACSLFSLEEQVVSCSCVVKSVALDLLLSNLRLYLMVTFEHAQDLRVSRNRFFTQENWRCVGRLMFNLLVPRVCS